MSNDKIELWRGDIVDNTKVESPYSPKYQRLFAKVIATQMGFTKQDLDDIVSIVFSDFKDNENNY